MTKDKLPMTTQQTFNFDDAQPQAEASQVAEETSLPPPLLRPDRQDLMNGLPHYEWPEPTHDKDRLSVDRVYDDESKGVDHRFTIARGDTVTVSGATKEDKTGTVVGISLAKNEVSVRFLQGTGGLWYPLGYIYPATEPEPAPLVNPITLTELVAKVSTEPESGFTEADIVHPPYSFGDYKDFRKMMAEGSLTFQEYQTHFKRLSNSKEQIISELQDKYNAKQLKVLASRFGDWNAKTNTKPKNANSIHQKMMLSFVLDGMVSYSMGVSLEQAVTEKVEAVTESVLALAIENASAANKAHEKALSNPETLDEYRTFLRSKSVDDLTDSQLATHDALESDVVREARKNAEPTSVAQFEAEAIGEIEFSIKEGYHDKKEIPLWIVQLSTRVDRPAFNELRAKAKQLSGWYSSFKKSDAGFQFTSLEDAESFTSLLSGDADRTEVLERRKERREQTASQRLTELAETLFIRADETIAASKESLQNTARRADMQAGVRGRAYADQAMSKTLTSIAADLALGNANYLDGIRHRTHVGVLQLQLRRAKWAHLRSIKHNDSEGVWERRNRIDEEEARPPNESDIRFAEYPFPTLYKRHLEEAVLKCGGRSGAKMAATKMAKRIAKADEYITFTKDYDIEALTDFVSRAKATGFDTEWLEKSVEDYRRLQRMQIESLHELRSALRELLPHIGAERRDDPVELAERELIGKKLPGFFPTPKSIIREMVELAGIEPNHSILEPSAGKGDILDAITNAHPENLLHAIEQNRTLQGVLSAKDYEVEFGDFLTHASQYDRILMNPPFEKGQDIEHVLHAYSLLAPGGRLVAIMGEGAFFRSDSKATEFRTWLEDVAGESEQLPENAFKSIEAFRHTGVRTRIVTIDKD